MLYLDQQKKKGGMYFKKSIIKMVSGYCSYGVDGNNVKR